MNDLSNIHEISSMYSLLDSKAENFFFDIEDTIFAENVYYTALKQNKFKDTLFKMVANIGHLNRITSYGKNFTRVLLDPNASKVLEQLRKKGKRLFSITSGFLSFPKIKKLQKLNINFEYIIFTKKIDKGPVLVKFLEKYHIQGSCAFIDNDLHKIENVQKYHDQVHNHNIELFLFKRDYHKDITMEKFRKYWQKVIDFFVKTRGI